MSRAAQRAHSSDTAVRILDVAQRLAQVRGFNGFSYADIATRLGVTKASLHYHFASKAQLGRALIVRYTERFCAALAEIDGAQPRETLRKYVELYESVLVRDEMCLCGMFAAEWSTLPAPMQAELRRFFDRNEVWLTGVLERGRARGLRFEGAALQTARTLTAGLEGAMLLSRSYAEPARFAEIATRLLSGIGVAPPGKGRSARRQTRLPDSRRRLREATN
jgi:TetR/AcrR family transcriptional regulator, transcriptional repressor for nem operon